MEVYKKILEYAKAEFTKGQVVHPYTVNHREFIELSNHLIKYGCVVKKNGILDTPYGYVWL